MKKMLYLMQEDWGWIAQRPHFMALELNKYYDITVVYPKQYIKRWKSQRELCELPNTRHGVYIPKQEKIRLFGKFAELTIRNAIGNLNHYDMILIGGDMMYKYIEGFKGKVIYDCMDDHVAMELDNSKKDEIKDNEDRLINRSDIILVSSLKLKEIIDQRGGETKTVLVRNGHNSKIHPIKPSTIKKHYDMGYIGTVSSWMDFNLLSSSLDKIENLSIHLIGPAPGYEAKVDNRILFEGVVEHSRIYEKIKDYDCLLMPFIVNDIILSVDPVKLYEYISYGKCIVSVYYPEVQWFSDFVYFYNNEDEFIELLSDLCKKGFPPKYNEVQQKKFLNDNTWNVRGKIVYESIEQIYRENQ